MSAPPGVFARLKSAAKNRMDPDRFKIVCRYDAPGGSLSSVTDAERSPHNFAHKKCVKERATPLQIDEVGPGKRSSASFAARRACKSEQSLLMGYRRVGTE